jgi:hypothetical protein
VPLTISNLPLRHLLASLTLAALACFAPSSFATNISGTVFEDVNYGGGTGQSSGTPLANVRVELYRQSSGAFVAAATTNGAGNFTLNTTGSAATQAAAYIVRVVNGTVRSSRTNGSTCTTCVPIQTFRTDASDGTADPVINRVGGENPLLSDAASNTGSANYSTLSSATTAAQSVAIADPVNSTTPVTGVDFGFNFDTIVNTRDASSCAPSGTNNTYFPCQGSLRQFIINANALGGEGSLAQSGSGKLDGTTTSLPSGYESSIFMIPSGQLTGNVAVIAVTSALPAVTGVNGANTRLDATTQTVNVGDSNSTTPSAGGNVGVDNILLPAIGGPEVQLNMPAASTTDCGASGSQLVLSASNASVVGFALRQGYILLSGSNGTARNNLVGMTATGSSTLNSPACYGITFSGSNTTIRNNYVKVNNSAIRSDTGGANSVIRLNDVARPDSGHTNTFDGILLINGASGVQILENLTRDQRGGGIELGFGSTANLYTGVLVENNTVSNNGFDSGSSASTEPLGMASYSYSASSTVTYRRNRVINNAGPGLMIMAAGGTVATQNVFSNNGGLSIDLDPVTREPNTMGAPNGVTLNDNTDGDTGPNGLLNYPVITSAIIVNGQLQLTGFARPTAAIELYLAQADPAGFGEGATYLTALTEGSVADLDTTTGTYGPAAINGIVQGEDTTNRFIFQIAVPGGVAVGSTLSGTATVGGQTSEFGGNVVVTGAPSLIHMMSVAVLSDPINNTTNPKSIPGAMQTYTVRITNQGVGTVDANTASVVVPVATTNAALYVLDIGTAGSGPIAFVNGSPSSGLTYTFTALNSTTDNVDFSNDGGATWVYVPTANADGCDSAVTHVRVRPQGAMAANTGSGNPYFEIRFRARVN